MSKAVGNILKVGNLINQIGTESVIAEAGSDAGLIPSFSLLSELADLPDAEPFSSGADAVKTSLDQRLDVDPTWSAKEIDLIQEFVNWGQIALSQAKEGESPFPFESAHISAAAVSNDGSQTPEESAAVDDERAKLEQEVDVLLELDPDEDQELLQEFHTEASDHLEQIEAALLTIEKDPDDEESLNSLFRSFHTIKGVAGFLRLVPLQKLAHNLESVLDRARNKDIVLDSRLVSGILEGKDAIEVYNNQIADCLSDGTLPSVIVKVSHIIISVNQAAEAQENGGDIPAPEDPEPGHLIADRNEDSTPLPTTLELAQSFFGQSSNDSNSSSEPPAATEASPDSNATATAVAPEPPTTAEPKPSKAPVKEQRPTNRRTVKKDDSFIRVNTGKLDNLMDMVGELVIVQSQIQESAHAETTDTVSLQRGVSQLSRITKELQHTSMALRMVPIKPTFQKAGRMVRDISKDLGKSINLETSGEETELDRNVIEMIGDPMVHMIRNAIDHGIESDPEDRVKAGKPVAGTIHLKAYHRGGSIVIEMADDGRGIDAERIFAKAVERGIVSPEDKLTDSDKRMLIFAPGFSTAEEVTDLSGRGVGMDVVRRNIENLRGVVEVDSVLGQGTTFRIKLPLTMAIIDGLVVKVGEERFILPTPTVKVALKPEPDQLSTIQGNMEVLDLRGSTIPVVRLHRVFDIEEAQEDITSGILVIIETASRPVALLVDEMVSKQEVVIKNLGSLLGRIKGVAGGAILGDGTIALILDPASLHNSKNSSGQHVAA